MANFALIVDRDPARRNRFIAAVAPRLHLLPGLRAGSCAAGDFQAVWAASPRAPIGSVSDPLGAAVVWGEAISPASADRITPLELRERWNPGSDPATWTTWDGFFAAVVFDPRFGLVAGADLLGLFPVYEWSDGDVLLVASSAEPFQHHPSFRRALDPAGLVGVMLTNGLFRGRTLWQGVNRLPPANFLRWRHGSEPAHSPDGRLANDLTSRDWSRLPPPEQLEALGGAVERALRRHTPPEEPCGLLLSGGLDSRLVAGYLDRQGTPTTALTLGLPGEIDVRCARRVARALGIEHRTAELRYERYPVFAETLTSRWEHLAAGWSVTHGWGQREFLGPLPARLANGIILEWIVGGARTLGLEPDQLSFDAVFPRKINDSGFPPALLGRLLRPGVFGDLLRSTLRDVRTDYEASADEPLRRLWRFLVSHRARFHGGVAGWRLCFGSWPALIALDRDLLATLTRLPQTTLVDRKAEQALLCREFPSLARLPLDRNGFLTTPLLAGRLRRWVDRFPSYARTRWRGRHPGAWGERRYYYRIHNLNNPGWIAIRRLAEPHRDALRTLFVPEVLDEILPPPDQPVRYVGDLIDEGHKLRQLLILALWAKDHL